jgi:hypothetical protein
MTCSQKCIRRSSCDDECTQKRSQRRVTSKQGGGAAGAGGDEEEEEEETVEDAAGVTPCALALAAAASDVLPMAFPVNGLAGSVRRVVISLVRLASVQICTAVHQSKSSIKQIEWSDRVRLVAHSADDTETHHRCLAAALWADRTHSAPCRLRRDFSSPAHPPRRLNCAPCCHSLELLARLAWRLDSLL